MSDSAEPDPLADDAVRVLDHGFVRLDGSMADDLSVVNGARVSFAKRKTDMDDSDAGLIRFLMRDRHGSPFEHNSFRFHIRCPIFVAREWMRHRVGCLTGDTVVTFVGANGDAHKKSVSELWRTWSAGDERAVRNLELRVLDEEQNAFVTGSIAAVVDKGVQPVYRLRLEDGKTLTVTENHRLLTTEGWLRMGAAVGLTARGEVARMTRDCQLMVNGVAVAEDISRLAAHAVSVESLTYVGLEQTYDLSVEGPWHNFVANGVVVHNSFNEFSLRYAVATDDFYVPEADDVRTQVGKPGAYTFEPVDAELAERTREELRAVYDHAYETYERLVEAGVAREVARSALPVGAYTQFYWTVNARSLMNFISLRNSEFAQREIRLFAVEVEAIFAEKMPVTYEAFVANNRTAP